MNDREKAEIEIKIANGEYRDPDFGVSWKDVLIGFVIGVLLGLFL